MTDADSFAGTCTVAVVLVVHCEINGAGSRHPSCEEEFDPWITGIVDKAMRRITPGLRQADILAELPSEIDQVLWAPVSDFCDLTTTRWNIHAAEQHARIESEAMRGHTATRPPSGSDRTGEAQVFAATQMLYDRTDLPKPCRPTL